MNVWRVHLRPDADDVDPIELCIKQEVVGIGWRAPSKPKDRDEYWVLGEKEYGDVGWRRALPLRYQPGHWTPMALARFGLQPPKPRATVKTILDV